MDFFRSRLGWAQATVEKHAKANPKPNTKAFWQWRCANLELAAYDKNCRNNGTMPYYALHSVNFSVDDRDQYMEALYADVTHRSNWSIVSSMMRRLHPGLTGMLKLVTLNTYNPNAKRGRDEEAIGAALQRREQVRGVAHEGILSQLLRIRSQHNAPFYTVLKSMVAFRQGLNKDYWRADTSQKLLMSYTWTHDFVLEMTNRPREWPFKLTRTVAFVVYDNCDYHRKKLFDRTDGEQAEYVKTVQLVNIPVPLSVGEISQTEIGARIMPFTRIKIQFFFPVFLFFHLVRRPDAHGGLLMTPRRHVTADLNPEKSCRVRSLRPPARQRHQSLQ